MHLKINLPISLLALTVFIAGQTLQAQKSATEWLTTPDGTSLFAQQKLKPRFTTAAASNPVIDVDDTKTFQTIDGFGYALTGGSAQLLMRMTPSARAAILHELFATKGSSIGVSYLRVSIGSSDLNDHVFSYDDMPAGETDPTLAKFSLAPDRADVIPILKQILAINPKIKILASPWTAPSWMKTNDDPKAGKLQPQFYPAYAAYLVKYLEGMKQEGIPIDTITIQNEPENPKNTPSMVMDASEEGTFIRDNFGPALQKAGLSTKIVLFDHNCDHPNYPIAILEDPATAKFVDGSGFHLYLGTIDALTKVHDAFPEKNLYFTEQMVVDAKGGTATTRIAEPVQRIIIGATRNWSRNVLLWNLAADPNNNPHTNNGGCTMCQGAITINGDTVTRNRAYYTLAHASKFVRPGSIRIDSNEPEGVANVAFRTPTGKTVLLVANNSAASQTFSVRSHGRAFATTLAAGAVATYIW
ncbi:MAG: glycoside hydrolase family 30 beta sandwich domain-containing protein [Edaphobacter sp.]